MEKHSIIPLDLTPEKTKYKLGGGGRGEFAFLVKFMRERKSNDKSEKKKKKDLGFRA